MSESISALAGAETGDLMIGVQDAGVVVQVTLKGDLEDKRIAQALNLLGGLAVPPPLGVSQSKGARAVWMAEDEVLILTGSGGPDAAAVVTTLQSALGDMHHLATDVSDARSVLRLSGEHVPEVLAKGAPVDLSPAGFPIGMARRTHLAGLAVAVWRLSGNDWEIVCLRSYAHHLWAWLQASGEPGSQVW